MEGRVYLAYSPREVRVHHGEAAWSQAADTDKAPGTDAESSHLEP